MSLTRISANNLHNISSPTSLYALDYGYHGGSFVYRGHFTANSNKETITGYFYY